MFRNTRNEMRDDSDNDTGNITSALIYWASRINVRKKFGYFFREESR